MKKKGGRTNLEMKEREVEKKKEAERGEILVRVEGVYRSHHPWKT